MKTWLDLFFSFIYIIDVIVKLLVTSFRNYWMSGANRFDFVVSVALFLALRSDHLVQRRKTPQFLDQELCFLSLDPSQMLS